MALVMQPSGAVELVVRGGALYIFLESAVHLPQGLKHRSPIQGATCASLARRHSM